jgi:tetratricopeptide (TPR) repeat protein
MFTGWWWCMKKQWQRPVSALGLLSLLCCAAHAQDSEVTEARRWNNLGARYFQEGRYEEAGKLFSQAMTVFEKHESGEAASLASVTQNLAAIERTRGHLADAERLYRRSLELLEHQPGTGGKLAGVLSNLSLLLLSLQRYAEAESLALRAVDLWKAVNGEHSLSAAAVYGTLGELCRLTGDVEKAMLYHRRALEIREKLLPAGHSDVAASLGNLGLTLAAAGNLVEAEAMLRQAVVFAERSLGPDHVNVAVLLVGNLGGVERKAGRRIESENHLRRALEIFEKSNATQSLDYAAAN